MRSIQMDGEEGGRGIPFIHSSLASTHKGERDWGERKVIRSSGRRERILDPSCVLNDALSSCCFPPIYEKYQSYITLFSFRKKKLLLT